MRRFLVVFLVISATSHAIPEVFAFYKVSRDTLNITFTQLEKAGVWRLDPYDPRLPYPQVSALEAFYYPPLGTLSYFDQETGGGTTYVFKNRQGGNRHRISFNESHIEFVTPYMGTVAHANRFKTVEGWNYHFWCQSQLVTKAAWDACIHNLFIQVIRREIIGK
jgi:hypothetical protein